VTIVPGQQRNQDPQKYFFLFAMLMKIEVKGEASKAQHLRVSETTPEAHCAKMPKSIQLRAFGGTGEPCIFLDRDAWDRGLVVPAYSLHIFKNFFAASFFRKTLISAKGKRPKSADAVRLSGKGKRHYTTRQ